MVAGEPVLFLGQRSLLWAGQGHAGLEEESVACRQERPHRGGFLYESICAKTDDELGAGSLSS